MCHTRPVVSHWRQHRTCQSLHWTIWVESKDIIDLVNPSETELECAGHVRSWRCCLAIRCRAKRQTLVDSETLLRPFSPRFRNVKFPAGVPTENSWLFGNITPIFHLGGDQRVRSFEGYFITIRRSSTLLSKVNLYHAIVFRALYGANLVM